MRNTRKTVKIDGYRGYHGYKQRKEPKTVKAPVCPYCGRVSVLRSAEYVYGENTITEGSLLYVCSGYPGCGAYVGVHEGTKKPKGMLADSELRNKRIRAHRAIDRIVRAGCMSKDGVYVWLSGRLNLPYEETHIGYFSDYLCEETIRECEKVMENWNGNRKQCVA